MVSGSIHFNGLELNSLSFEQLRAIRGSKISMIFQDPMTSLNPVIPCLLYTSSKAPFDNVLVRRAIAHAVDKDALVNGISAVSYTHLNPPQCAAPARY